METLSQRAKRLRTERGWTQAELGKRAGLSQVTISDIERGRNQGSREIIPLADALGVSPTYLTTGKEIPDRRPAGGRGKSTQVALRHISDVAQAGDSIIIGLFHLGAMKSDQVAVRAIEVSPQWVRENLPGVDDAGAVRLLICTDDSMAGTFSRGDVIALDTSITEVHNDGVYAFTVKQNFFLKRLQRLTDGGLMVISDNKKYMPYKLTVEDCESMAVKGQALYSWSGNRL
jgi:phage repressor protein C with HTH and peptisase S24 domain